MGLGAILNVGCIIDEDDYKKILDNLKIKWRCEKKDKKKKRQKRKKEEYNYEDDDDDEDDDENFMMHNNFMDEVNTILKKNNSPIQKIV